MEKLDKVIAGLRCCGADAYPGYCEKCPYDFEKDLSCLDALCNEAVEVLEALKAERDDLRKDVAVLTSDLMGKKYEPLELCTCYCPICDKHFEVRSNDSMGNCPDCGHHVVLHEEVSDV
jgi:DNA-directed RNA polymerase subunit RPC12/RpoP